MRFLMSLVAECSFRWNIVKNNKGKFSKVQRFFALLEIVCFPVSIISILLLAIQSILFSLNLGVWIPEIWLKYVMPILLAGAVGYLTNWLAIIMLFRPYSPKKWLFIWKQGLIPRHKSDVAKAVGYEVGNELLAPERLADELCETVLSYLTREDVINNIKEKFQVFLREHKNQILSYLLPQVEKSLITSIDNLVTSDNIKTFWTSEIEPRLKSENTRNKIAEYMVSFGKENAPTFVNEIRKKLRNHLNLKLVNIPLPEFVIEIVMDFFADKTTIQKMITNWLGESNTHKFFQEKLLLIYQNLTLWINSPEGKEKIENFSIDAKVKLKKFLSNYLSEALPNFAENALGSERLWTWFEIYLIPEARIKLVDYIQSHKQEIIDNLKISKRIENAINEQDVRKFHNMVNRIGGEHLGAIQVLGFVLGIIIGGLQLFQTLFF